MTRGICADEAGRVAYRETVLILNRTHATKYKMMAAAVSRLYARLCAVNGAARNQPPLPPEFAKQKCRCGFVRYERYACPATTPRIVVELVWYTTAAGRVRAIGDVYGLRAQDGVTPREAWVMKLEQMDRGGFNHGHSRAMEAVLDVHGANYSQLSKIDGFTSPDEVKNGRAVRGRLHQLYPALIAVPADVVGGFFAGDARSAARVLRETRKLAAAGESSKAAEAEAYAHQIYLARAAADLAAI